jgi:integrase
MRNAKVLVLRYRFPLEERGLAPGTINLRMAAVRRLAYEAADSGLLSPVLAAGIQRVKGVRKLGSRLGNWLTASEASALWQLPDARTLAGKRNGAILAILLGLRAARHQHCPGHSVPAYWPAQPCDVVVRSCRELRQPCT